MTLPSTGDIAKSSPKPVDTNTFSAPKANPPAEVSASESNGGVSFVFHLIEV